MRQREPEPGMARFPGLHGILWKERRLTDREIGPQEEVGVDVQLRGVARIIEDAEGACCIRPGLQRRDGIGGRAAECGDDEHEEESWDSYHRDYVLIFLSVK